MAESQQDHLRGPCWPRPLCGAQVPPGAGSWVPNPHQGQLRQEATRCCIWKGEVWPVALFPRLGTGQHIEQRADPEALMGEDPAAAGSPCCPAFDLPSDQRAQPPILQEGTASDEGEKGHGPSSQDRVSQGCPGRRWGGVGGGLGVPTPARQARPTARVLLQDRPGRATPGLPETQDPWTKISPTKGLNSHLAERNQMKRTPARDLGGENRFNQSGLLVLGKTGPRSPAGRKGQVRDGTNSLLSC